MTFRTGDVCLLVGTKREAAFECWPYLGKEVTLVPWIRTEKMWNITAEDGYLMRCDEKNLVKKKPPNEDRKGMTIRLLGSWDEVHRLTGWRPRESNTVTPRV